MQTLKTAVAAAILCGLTGVLHANPQTEFDRSYAAAEQARQQSAAVGGEWREVGKLLDAAKKAAASGDFAKATLLAGQAQQQSELGYRQAREQQGHTGNPAYLHLR